MFMLAGEAAVAAAKHQEPAALLVDVDLPDVSGFEVLEVLKAHLQHDVPVVLLTAKQESLHQPSERSYSGDALVALRDVGTLRDRLSSVITEHAIVASVRQALSAALAAPLANEFTDEEQEVLESVGFPVTAGLSPAPIARRAAHFEQLVKSSLTTEQAARKLKVNSSRIRQRLTASPPQLYGIRRRNEWRLPAFQFARQGLVPSIDTVIAHLRSGLDPVAVDNWFRLPNVDLVNEKEPLSPLDWLSQGLSVQLVADLAADL